MTSPTYLIRLRVFTLLVLRGLHHFFKKMQVAASAASQVQRNNQDHLEYLSSLTEWQQKTFEKSSPAAKDSSREALILKEKGNAFLKLERYKEAMICYTKAIKLSAETYVLLLNRAQAFLKMEDWARAEQDCSDYISKCSDRNLKAYWRRASARTRMGDISGAQSDFERALVLEPTNSAVKSQLEVKSFS